MTISDQHATGHYTVAAKQIIGANVVDAAQEDVGKIEDLIIDSRDSRVAYAILSVGGFLGMGDSRFPVPWDAIDFDADRRSAALKLERERLKDAPTFDSDTWPDMTNDTWHDEIHKHYGLKR